MKYLSSLSLVVCLLLAAVDFRVETKEIKFHVSPGKEDIYYRFKRRSPSVRHPVEEKHTTKDKICAAILESDFFDSRDVELVDPHHPDVHDKIKQHDPKMFYKHFINHSHDSDAHHELKFLNPYVLNDVLVHGLFIREWMFLCLAKNVKTHSVQQYFVSPMHHTTDGKVIRFVFAHNDRREMVLIARAEGNSTVDHHNRSQRDHRAQTTATGTTKAEEDDDYSESEEDDSYEDEEEYENDTDEEKDDQDEYDDSDEDEYSDEKDSDE